MNLATKRRRVKDSMRKVYQQFQEEKKKKKDEKAPSTSPADASKTAS
jgi:hypothetical protein